MDLFSFSEYKSYLHENINKNKSARGYQGRCATAAGCHKTFFSQVLHSHVHLTMDHAAGLCRFWQFDDEETHYFLDLVQFERAGTPELRRVIEKRLRDARKRRENLAQRLHTRQLDDPAKEVEYFSQWWLSLLHVALSLNNCGSPARLSERLELPLDLVLQGLQTLAGLGFASRNAHGEWTPTGLGLHLAQDSLMSRIYHQSWRLRLIERHLHPRQPTDLSYLALHTLSRTDAAQFRETLIECIEATRALVKPSPPEDAFAISIDFVRLSR